MLQRKKKPPNTPVKCKQTIIFCRVLELLTKPKAARRPAGRRLVVKPGGRRPDWLALGSRDLEVVEAWGWAGGGAGAAAV